MSITPSVLPCIACGQPSEVAISIERRGVIGHYGSCMEHIERVASRVRSDGGYAAASRAAPAMHGQGTSRVIDIDATDEPGLLRAMDDDRVYPD